MEWGEGLTLCRGAVGVFYSPSQQGRGEKEQREKESEKEGKRKEGEKLEKEGEKRDRKRGGRLYTRFETRFQKFNLFSNREES